MYICDECGNVFENYIEEKTDYGKTISVSPCCSETFEEATTCPECGKYIIDDNFNILCEDCSLDTLRKYNQLVRDNFNVSQIKYIMQINE